MKKTYKVGMNENGQGGKFHVRVSFTVQASSEFEAKQIAQKRHPEYKVCYIEEV